MIKAIEPDGEAGRIASLHDFAILDTKPEAEFDSIVKLASTFCETPIALISLVDRNRQWFKSKVGLDADETPRDVSFCAHAILKPGEALVVPDATLDRRFSDNPLVTGDASVRFYAGIPLVTKGGDAIGTLCTIDRVPRQITQNQLQALRVAATSVMLLMEKRRADSRLRLLEMVAVHASDGVAIVEIDAAGRSRIAYVNAAFTLLTGYEQHELEATKLGHMLSATTREKHLRDTAAAAPPHETVIDAPFLPCKNDTTLDVEIRLSPIVDRLDEDVRNVVVILRDKTEQNRAKEAHARTEIVASMNAELQHEIVERRRVEQQLSHLASHDALTGLPNRTLFKKYVEQAIASCRDHTTQSAVAFIDLDHFKTVNDSLGHLMGDALLVGVARRLQGAIRPKDTVSRFAGDEFTVLLNDVHNETEAAHVIERLGLAFKEPFLLEGTEVFATASIGASMIRAAHTTAEEVLRDADIAMFTAKENGRARAQFFNQRLNDRFAAVTQLQTSLFGALQRDEFRLLYQPIVSLRSPGHPLQGFEALVRWKSSRGECQPDAFIPAAEETGLIVPLGEWILNEACDRIAAWHPKYAGRFVPMPTVSVNVSAKQFVSPQFVDQVERAIKRTGIDPSFLALELTETTLMEDAEKGRNVLAALRERGVKIYLDDFGTGYCSFAYLRRFGVDCLKIDRSFVSGGDGSDKTEQLADPAIVRAIISLAESLKIHVIAEGVETEAQVCELEEMRCPAAQGYLFNRPLEDTSRVLESACDA